MNPHPDHRFLALGDSYTIGEGVAAGDGWPAQLARRLRALGSAIGDPDVVARTGWTTDELAAAMDARTFVPPYALVTLLIGVNDQYRGGELADYAGGFARLLGRAIALAGGDARRVVVLSIPDWGVTRFARAQARDAAQVAAAIDAFNAAAGRQVADAGAAFVDVTAISREAGDGDAMLVGDGLHPSAAQYALWADAAIPAARRALAPAASTRSPRGRAPTDG
jgi:lysophospholipase L1-like esterase